MKLTKHAWILWSIALAVVLVLALVISFAKTAVYWIGLLCTVAMFGVCALAFVRAFRKDSTLESKLLGWPIFKVGYVAEVAVFAVTVFCMTVKDAAREAVTTAEVKVADNTAAWKAIRARANAIAAETGHPDIKKLAEEIRYADPMPTSMDGEIAQMLETLSSYADAANIKKALGMMEQRQSFSKEEK